MADDPLGLTADQRMWSNSVLVMSGRGGEAWWPGERREPGPRVIDGEWTEACPHCRAITGHVPGCIGIAAAAIEGIWS